MTDRRPPGISTGDWIERRIREAEARGEFADLPGAGKPLDLTRPGTDLDYVAKVAKREQLSPLAFLPPSLRLARELEDLPDTVRALPTEARVRAAVEDLNRRIREEIPKPQVGPPLRARPVDVDDVVRRWATERQQLADAAAARAVERAAAEPAARTQRRWFRRRGHMIT